ncbi:phosphatidylglycerophosphatase A family protein [Glaciecola sp. 1036]|uniref:phosphatidylglycerophosphatase A family protein n=1 Tax=Alteromonadaceae TaxID=72275 RepID=UPI003D01D96D
MDKLLRQKVSLKNPQHFFALGMGSGLIPLMPGTFGSLAAIPFLIAMAFMPVSIFVVVTLLSIVIGIYICDKTAVDMGVHDHGSIVWDEIAGMFVTFLFVPINWKSLLIGFILFRLFDILKPWPIRLFDKKVDGGLGIMLDDVVAGLLACVIMQGLIQSPITEKFFV